MSRLAVLRALNASVASEWPRPSPSTAVLQRPCSRLHGLGTLKTLVVRKPAVTRFQTHGSVRPGTRAR